MKFKETKIKNAYLIQSEPFQDHRGIFVRTFCSREFKKHGLQDNMVQSNLSISYKKNILRGMHYQIENAAEDKLVKCLKGSLLDVVIDIRKKSETFGKYIMVKLTDSNNLMLYIPKGCAHGFLTLENNCYVFYQVSNFYSPEKERGIRWNDPFFNIKWPIENPIISEKDASYENFRI